MAGKAGVVGNASNANLEEHGPASPSVTCLKSLEGRQEAAFTLLDPGTLNDASYGYRGDAPWIISNEDARSGVGRLPAGFVDCVVTSPPYYWQRDYDVAGQTGQEDTIEAYVEVLTRVFREVRRVLKPTGTAFLVLGDTYYSGRGQLRGGDPKQVWRGVARQKYRAVDRPGFGLPKKSLLGVPWRVALALQADGWVLRSSVVWRKTKPLAEPSVRDRPWTTTETIFILAKTGTYHFDRDGLEGQEDVWDIPAPNAPRRYRHAAPFPEALVARCLAAGCPPAGVVLDPYAGLATGAILAYAAAPERCDLAKGSLWTFLCTIAKRDAVDLVRAARRRDDLLSEVKDYVEFWASRAKHVFEGEDAIDARRIMALHRHRLVTNPDEERLLALILGEEKRTEAFAAALGLDPKAADTTHVVKQAKDRMLLRLRRLRDEL